MRRERSKELMALRLPGGVTPERLPIHDLVEIISALESGLTAIAKQIIQGQSLPKDFLIALSSVRESGSTEVAVSSPTHDLADMAAAKYSVAVSTGQVESLPEESRRSVDVLRHVAQKRGLDIELKRDDKVVAVIRPVLEEAPAAVATGGSSLFGVVEDVGGAKPRIVLRIPPDERVTCEAGEDLCLAVAPRLYSHVVLEGAATWEMRTGRLLTFRAERLAPYEDVPTAEAFGVLRKVFEESDGSAGEAT